MPHSSLDDPDELWIQPCLDVFKFNQIQNSSGVSENTGRFKIVQTLTNKLKTLMKEDNE